MHLLAAALSGKLTPMKTRLLLLIAAVVPFALPASGQTKKQVSPSARRLTPPVSAPVSFLRDVEPILTRRGCSLGACHGAQYGKGGFKLSLAGFDPDLDEVNLVKQMRGRRVNLAKPSDSLFLTKPTMGVPHGGGLRFTAKERDYGILLRWLQEGAHGPDPSEPALVSICVTPAERVAPKGSPLYPLRVTAAYADGLTRDVTDHTRITSLNDGIASATPEGMVQSLHSGQTSIMVRYGGFAAVSTVIVPYGKVGAFPAAPPAHKRGTKRGAAPVPAPNAGRPTPSLLSSIDALVARKQAQLNLLPSPPCDDAAFLRRVSLDLIGTLPTPNEVTSFLKDQSANKREQCVDRLLSRPEYTDYWALKWGDLLRVHRSPLGAKGMWSFRNWIHTEIQQNAPLDEMVRELLTAKGSAFTNGPANLYRVAREPQDLTEMTSQVFLGVRMQCAKCHQHPFEKWSQKDYYQYAAFFARIRTKDSRDFGLFGQEQVVRVSDDGEIYHPKTGRKMIPTPLGAKLISLPSEKEASLPDPDAGGDRRVALAEWITSKSNRLFARNFANRYWGYLFGRGIVNPIDDLRVTNPASNPELLDFLADYLVTHHYNAKALLRLICTSQTYRRSSEPTEANRDDEVFFTHYLPKRLPAETLLDAIDSACGTRENYNDLPAGTRAIQLPDPAVYNEFLDTFGRPVRQNSCECERVSEINLSQTLRMLNGDTVNNKVREEGGRLRQSLNAKRAEGAVVEELYLASLGRRPTLREKRIALGVITFAPDRRQAFEDVLLTLLNSKEFLFIR